MLYYVIITGFFVVAGYLLSHWPLENSPFLSREASGFGYLVLSSIFGGKILSHTILPQVTGYMLTGILVGPAVLSIVDNTTLLRLSFIDEVALALIAFAAGAKVKLKDLKGNTRDLWGVILFQILSVILIFSVFSPLFIRILNIKGNFSTYVLVWLILITAAIAKSPATTIAIIMETKAQGKFSDIIVGITILKDIIIVFLFTLVIALISAGEHIGPGIFYKLILELLLSIIIGIFFAALIIFYFSLSQGGKFSFILILAFLIASVSHHLHFHSILAAMSAGIAVTNLSPYGHDFLDSLYDASVPILAVFFSVTGASMDFSTLKTIFLATILFVIVRIFSLYAGTWVGARYPSVKKYGWMAFISQAGLTLGFASLVGDYFPKYGLLLKNLIISTVVVSMLIGPPLFLISLRKAGDAS